MYKHDLVSAVLLSHVRNTLFASRMPEVTSNIVMHKLQNSAGDDESMLALKPTEMAQDVSSLICARSITQ